MPGLLEKEKKGHREGKFIFPGKLPPQLLAATWQGPVPFQSQLQAPGLVSEKVPEGRSQVSPLQHCPRVAGASCRGRWLSHAQ